MVLGLYITFVALLETFNLTWQSPLLLTDCFTKIKLHIVLVIVFLFSLKKPQEPTRKSSE